ncbi:hypothetical protein BN1708_016593, partial [Verticillium longisporum]
MIFGRVIAGIGGGGLMSISTFLASDLVPLRKRGIIQGVGNIAYGGGAMLGGVFGGLINDHTAWGWRLAFLIQVPPVIVSAIIVAVLVRVPPKASDKSYLARIDFVGAFLTISFLVLLLLGLNAGGNIVPWLHPLPLTTIPLSVVAFVAFIIWESRAKQPIIPVKLLMHRTVIAACLCNFLSTMVIMMALFYVPLYLQVIGLSATDAGLRLLPSPLGISPTPHWIESWLPELPLHTILTVIQQVSALLPRQTIANESASTETLQRIQEIQLVGVDPAPVRVHSFEWSQLALGWYESLVWSFVFSSEIQVARGTAGVWNGTAIKLFRVQETAAEGPTLTSPRG